MATPLPVPPSKFSFFSTTTAAASITTIKILSFPPKDYKPFKPLRSSSTNDPREEEEEAEPSDPVKMALAKAEAYRKSRKSSSTPIDSSADAEGSGNPPKELPASVKLAMEKARKYKKNKGTVPKSGQEEMNVPNTTQLLKSKERKKEEPKISSIDFVGFGFSDKKSYRGMPPGLSPAVEPFFDGEIPEVELIVGDASKFEVKSPQRKSSNEDSDNLGLYKPKVSTWGVFPRPSNISKTFGGGRVIRPGEALETVEDKAAKDKQTKALIATYKRKRGLTIDVKTKLECEKALKIGDDLMDLGKLREALPYYEKVMKKVVFQSELHGSAALQWSICQDSLSRSKDARSMYEKLQSHPNVEIRKKARQFMFSFQAMDMMKVSSSSLLEKTGYENYFEAFIANKGEYTTITTTTTTEEEEGSEGVLKQSLPYIMFLISPILVVVLIAVRKSF